MADEHQSLTRASQGRKPKGYGAAVSSNDISYQPKQSVVTHKVLKSDSLTSLAIKYNSTVADIKRANKLWNNESLGFRDTIDIPIFNSDLSTHTIGSSSEHDANHSLSVGSSTSHAADISNNAFFKDFDNLTSSAGKNSTSAGNDVTPTGPQPTLASNGAAPTLSIDNKDFFARFDESFTFLKKKVEGQTQYTEEDLSTNNPEHFMRSSNSGQKSRNGKGKDSSSQRNSRSSVKSFTDDMKTTPEPVVKAKVERKLRKHKERQEELFSL